MSTLDAGAVADSAVRLGLLSIHHAEEAWAQVESRKSPPQEFLSCMEQKGYLTPYQSGKLVKGDTDGYFLGGYRVLYKIASGSFGRVYRCDDPSSGRSVAIKVLRKKWSEDKRKIEQFMREAQVGMSLRHSNIVEILAVNHEKSTNQYYIVMEFVEGGNLRDFLKVRKTLSPVEVLRVLEDTAAALACAFAKGITHRDMKLTNILLSSQGPAKLVDFGLAGGQFTATGDETGEVHVDRTVDYAGLERVTNVEQGDKRSDIFFLGCVAYELLSGRSPLEYSRSAQARMSAQRFQKIIPLGPHDMQAPMSLFRLVEGMMDLEPESRIQTPAQCLERVRECRIEIEGAAKGGTGAAKAQATIFLAENDEKLQDLLRSKLKEEGFRILLAADPVRALDRFRQQPFDILIVDASTTGENGYFVFERIMDDAKRQGLGCRGILMLGADQVEWKDRLTEYADRIATLTQPIKYKQLLQTIRDLLAKTI
jgi:CheY-like chemotaxis protein/tRNA A-37 threonylcarbamoyl transferase component Bud32